MLIVPATGARGAETRPNIIVILADDFGLGDVKCYGGRFATPNLDRMAEQGIRFTHFYVAAPICSASRAALITGQFPARWRINSYLQTRKGNRDCEQADFLPPSAPSLPRVLKSAGYATAHIGKWHLGGGRDVTNAPVFAAYGYDVGLGTYESPEPHPDITATNWIWSPRDKVKRWERTRWMVDRTLEFLSRHPNQPCFVNLWLDDTHTPWIPSAELQDNQARRGDTPRNFEPVLTEMDRQIGRLLSELEHRGSASNTLVLFLSDNGPLPPFQQKRTAGLRGSKLSLYEGGLNVPLIAWWPGQIAPGRVNDKTVVSSLDLFPILTRVAHGKAPDGVLLDGEDLTDVLFGKTPMRTRSLFWEYGRNAKSYGYPGIIENRSPNVAMREGAWKLLVNADGTGAELYDVEHDRNERQNVVSANPAVAERLMEAALRWRKAMP